MLQRTGESEYLGEKEKEMLLKGSVSQKQKYERYGLSFSKNEDSHRTKDTPASSSTRLLSNQKASMNAFSELERDLRSPSLLSHMDTIEDKASIEG